MTARCKECKSTNIVWDAWVDCDGMMVASFDYSECYDCGSEDIEHDVEQEKEQDI
jgi:hypothetical protein